MAARVAPFPQRRPPAAPLASQLSSLRATPPTPLRRLSRPFITRARRRTGPSGVPEAASGYAESPPRSSSREASRTIAKECERLLCGDMARIFLGGRNGSNAVAPRSMDSIIEVWDYVGGTSFRGFVAKRRLKRGMEEKTLFLFFEHVKGTQLKHGLMALIELASECFHCERLVICLDRNGEGLQGLVRDLGWVGFELITLSHWVTPEKPVVSSRSASFSSTSTMSSVFSDDDVTSEKWLFMGMEV